MYVNEFRKNNSINCILFCNLYFSTALHLTLGRAQQYVEYNAIYMWERTIN